VKLLFVCLGGALGSGARYLFGGFALRTLGPGFPFGTLGVNLIGSFLIMAIMQLSLVKGAISADARLFLVTGVMGGFTTYSSFNYETIQLLREGTIGLAFLNLTATLLGCLASGALALLLTR
jgi:CrcB protein